MALLPWLLKMHIDFPSLRVFTFYIIHKRAHTHTRTLTRLNMAIVDTLQTIISREGSIQDTYYWIHMDS